MLGKLENIETYFDSCSLKNFIIVFCIFVYHILLNISNSFERILLMQMKRHSHVLSLCIYILSFKCGAEGNAIDLFLNCGHGSFNCFFMWKAFCQQLWNMPCPLIILFAKIVHALSFSDCFFPHYSLPAFRVWIAISTWFFFHILPKEVSTVHSNVLVI